MTDVDDFLEHYGVAGMRWGVRKSSVSTSSGGKKPKISNDAKRAEFTKSKMKKGGVKALSDKEIVALQKRLDLEKKLKDVAPKGKNKEVNAFVSNIASNVVKGAITAVATQQVSAVLKKAMNKA